MEMYLDDLIAYKSLYLLMQNKTSRNLEGELNELKQAAETRCKMLGQYSMIESKEKTEETSLAPITEEIFLLKQINKMIGHIRMFFNKNKAEKPESQETQQEAMAKLMLERYEKIIFAPPQIETVLGKETIMKVLGKELSEYIKGNDKSKTKSKSKRREIKAMEH